MYSPFCTMSIPKFNKMPLPVSPISSRRTQGGKKWVLTLNIRIYRALDDSHMSDVIVTGDRGQFQFFKVTH